MFKVLTEGCEPKRATKYSAAVDLFAAEDVVIKAGETAKVRLGVCIDHETILDWIDTFYPLNEGMLPEYKMDYFLKTNYLQVSPRSSLGLKGLIIPNGIGIIDLDYKSEICLILHNPIDFSYMESDGKTIHISISDKSENGFKISKGEKIAQIMLCEHRTFLMGYESDTERVGGFGHSGK